MGSSGRSRRLPYFHGFYEKAPTDGRVGQPALQGCVLHVMLPTLPALRAHPASPHWVLGGVAPMARSVLLDGPEVLQVVWGGLLNDSRASECQSAESAAPGVTRNTKAAPHISFAQPAELLPIIAPTP